MSFKIKAAKRLLASDRKHIKDLSDSTLYKISRDKSDNRSSQAKSEIKRRDAIKNADIISVQL